MWSCTLSLKKAGVSVCCTAFIQVCCKAWILQQRVNSTQLLCICRGSTTVLLCPLTHLQWISPHSYQLQQHQRLDHRDGTNLQLQHLGPHHGKKRHLLRTLVLCSWEIALSIRWMRCIKTWGHHSAQCLKRDPSLFPSMTALLMPHLYLVPYLSKLHPWTFPLPQPVHQLRDPSPLWGMMHLSLPLQPSLQMCPRTMPCHPVKLHLGIPPLPKFCPSMMPSPAGRLHLSIPRHPLRLLNLMMCPHSMPYHLSGSHHPFPSPANMPTENLPSDLPTHDACSVQRVTPGYPTPSLADMPTFNPHAERHDPPQSETGPNNPPPAQAQSWDPQPSQSGTHESPPCQTELQSPSLADMPTPNPHAEHHDPPQPETGLNNPLPAQAQFGDHPPSSQAGAHESPPSQAELHTHPSTPPVNNIMGSTLLIGSSQLKLVKPRFLHKTLVQTMRGATVLDAYSRLSNTTLGPYSQIILQFGSNDLDRRPEMVVLEYKLLLNAVRLNTKSTSKIFISAIPPRLDRRAEAAKCLNGHLSSLADPVANIFFLSHDSAFATAAVPHGLASCLARDKYHLNKKGTGILLSSLNETLGFVKPHRSSHMPAHQRHHRQGSQLNQRRCYNCGETNHLRDRCWYGRKLQCRICHIYGHKASACFERHQSNNQEIPALDSLEDFPSLPVQDGVEQATSPPPNFVENRFPNHFPHAAGKTFRSHPDQCPAIPRTARSVQERPWASQTVPTTIPVVRLTTPVHPMIDELSIGANPYQSGTMHAPQWSHTTPMYPMIHELPVHANPYQFGTQHALQWSHPHHDRNYVSQYHVAEIDQHTWPHLSY